MLLRCLRAEICKCRRAPVWLAFVVLPVVPAILGTANYLGNIEVLDNAWYSLWSQHTLFSSLFFLPALLGVFCAWQWRLEQAGHNWNSFFTAPVPLADLCLAKLILAAGTSVLAKLILAAGTSVLAQGCIGGLFVLSGKLVGLPGPVPPELPGWLFCGAVGSISVCAVQLFVSLAVRTFAPPVAFGLAGGILGLLCTAKGWGYHAGQQPHHGAGPGALPAVGSVLHRSLYGPFGLAGAKAGCGGGVRAAWPMSSTMAYNSQKAERPVGCSAFVLS